MKFPTASRWMFGLKLIPLAVGVFFLGTLAMGPLSQRPEFQGSGDAAHPLMMMTPLELYKDLFQRVTHLPEACWEGNPSSDFQAHQCEEFWARLSVQGVLAALPVGLVLIFYFIAFDRFLGFFRRCRKVMDAGKAIATGVVTQPPLAPPDPLARLFGLRCVSIELKKGVQTVAYLRVDDPNPLPGQNFAIFDLGVQFGKKRLLAVLYAPHLTVVRGI